MFRGKCSSRLGPEDQEPRYKFGIDPVGLGAGSKATREGLDLGRWYLASFDACIFQIEPEPPFLPARRFQANDSPAVSGQIDHGTMTGAIAAPQLKPMYAMRPPSRSSRSSMRSTVRRRSLPHMMMWSFQRVVVSG